MRLGIDARSLHGRSAGIGYWTRNLLTHLPLHIPDLELFLYLPDGYDCEVPTGLTAVHLRTSRSYPGLGGLFWLKFKSVNDIASDKLDAFFAPRTIYPSHLERVVPVISAVHDFNHIVCPATMPKSLLISHKLWFQGDLASATKVVSNSQGTADRLKLLIGRDADAIIRPSVEPAFHPSSYDAIEETRRRYNLRAPYILFVGTIEPRKQVDKLIEAYMSIKGSRSLDLVLIGYRGWCNRALKQTLNSDIPGLHELGYVPREHLPHLYSGAECLVLPSIYEGYGMPAAEAMACGTRVVTTDTPELREATNSQGTYVQPTSRDIAEGIIETLQLPPLAPVRTTSWSESARSLADLLISVV